MDALHKQLHIGIDLDNTIALYDQVFFKYALQLGLITSVVEPNKTAIRDYIRLLPDGNEKWTRLQGLVYGQKMAEAELATGVVEFLAHCKTHIIKLSIISHRTLYPALGPRTNLHMAARNWLEQKKLFVDYGVSANDIFFETQLERKLQRIKNLGCTHFIDDLEEVLLHKNFPVHVQKIVYSLHPKANSELLYFKNWYDITNYFQKTTTPTRV